MHAASTGMTDPDPDPADVTEPQVRTNVDGAVALFPGALAIGAQQTISLDGMLREAPRTLGAASDLLLS